MLPVVAYTIYNETKGGIFEIVTFVVDIYIGESCTKASLTVRPFTIKRSTKFCYLKKTTTA